MKQRVRRGGLLLEFAVIIVGALLALALDDWRDNREREARDRVVLEQLAAELSANRSALETESAYHREILDPIRTARLTMQNSGNFALPEDWEGIRPILLTRSAFDLAVMTGVLARVPADTALSLARTYEEAERAQERRGNVSLATLQTSFTDGVRWLRLQEQGVVEELESVERLVPLLERAEAQVAAVVQ